jgi:hypothetical protein
MPTIIANPDPALIQPLQATGSGTVITNPDPTLIQPLDDVGADGQRILYADAVEIARQNGVDPKVVFDAATGRAPVPAVPTRQDMLREDVNARYLPNVSAGFEQGARSIWSLGQRMLGDSEGAAETIQYKDDLAAASPQGVGPQVVQGVAQSIPAIAAGLGTSLVAGPVAGFGVMAGLPAATTTNEAYEQTGDIGYAVRQGGIEGVVTGLFQSVGAGGLEKVALRGMKAGLRQFGKATMSELTEEEAILLAQNVNTYLSGVDPNALDKPKMVKDMSMVALQTLATMGLAGSVNATAQRMKGSPAAPVKPPTPAEQLSAPSERLGLPAPQEAIPLGAPSIPSGDTIPLTNGRVDPIDAPITPSNEPPPPTPPSWPRIGVEPMAPAPQRAEGAPLYIDRTGIPQAPSDAPATSQTPSAPASPRLSVRQRSMADLPPDQQAALRELRQQNPQGGVTTAQVKAITGGTRESVKALRDEVNTFPVFVPGGPRALRGDEAAQPGLRQMPTSPTMQEYTSTTPQPARGWFMDPAGKPTLPQPEADPRGMTRQGGAQPGLTQMRRPYTMEGGVADEVQMQGQGRQEEVAPIAPAQPAATPQAVATQRQARSVQFDTYDSAEAALNEARSLRDKGSRAKLKQAKENFDNESSALAKERGFGSQTERNGNVQISHIRDNDFITIFGVNEQNAQRLRDAGWDVSRKNTSYDYIAAKPEYGLKPRGSSDVEYIAKKMVSGKEAIDNALIEAGKKKVTPTAPVEVSQAPTPPSTPSTDIKWTRNKDTASADINGTPYRIERDRDGTRMLFEGDDPNPVEVNLKSVADAKRAAEQRARPNLDDPRSGAVDLSALAELPGAIAQKGKEALSAVGRSAKRNLTSAGDMPLDAFDRYLKAGALKNVISSKGQDLLLDMQRSAKQEGVQNMQAVDSYIKGDTKVALPPKTKEAADRMRNYLDKISQYMVKRGIVTGDMAATFQNNIGTWTRRSYRVFDEGRAWVDSVKQDPKLWGDAVKDFNKRYMDIRPDNSTVTTNANGKKTQPTRYSGVAAGHQIEVNKVQGGFQVNIDGTPAIVVNTLKDMNEMLRAEMAKPKFHESGDLKYADGALSALMESYADKANGGKFGAISSPKGAMDIGSLTRRSEVLDNSPAMRAVMGEYVDPTVNFARSVETMADMMANDGFMRDVRKMGLQAGWLKTAPDATHNVPIASEGNRRMKPLTEGQPLYTTREIADSFQQRFSNDQDANPVMRGYRMANTMARSAATSLSIPSQARNFISGPLLVARLGVDLKGVLTGDLAKDMAMATNVVARKPIEQIKFAMDKNGYSPTDKKVSAYRREALRLRELGILDTDVSMGILRDNFRDAMGAGTPGSNAKSYVRRAFNAAGSVYQAGDNFWKTVAYYNLKRLHEPLKAERGWSDAQLEEHVAKIIRDEVPNYNMLGNFVRSTKDLPVRPDFIAWPAERLRNTANSLNRIQQGLRSDSPAERKIAANSAASLLATMSAPAAMGIAAMHHAGMDEEKDEAFRRTFAYDWQKNSPLFYMKDDNGSVRYVDGSFTDVDAAMSEPLAAILAGEDWTDSFLRLGNQIMANYGDPGIFTGAVIDLARNKTEQGWPVWLEGDTLPNKAVDGASHLAKPLVPNTLKQLERVRKGITGEEQRGRTFNAGDEAMAFGGVRSYSMDIPKVTVRVMRDRKNDLTQQTRIYNENIENRGMDPQAAFEQYSEARTAVMQEMIQAYQDSLTLVSTGKGENKKVDPALKRKIDKSLREAGLSKAELYQVTTGRISPVRPPKPRK